MLIEHIQKKETWENFLKEFPEKSFLHSWQWGEFQKSLGEKIWRVRINSGLALIIKVSAKRGTFLLCPYGPLLKDKGDLKYLLDYLKKLAKKEKASFIRICPIWKQGEDVFNNLGFRRAPIHIHPENNWVLGLNKTEEELLMGMRKNTRNLIRRAGRNADLTIEERTDLKAVEIFNDIYQKTYKRQGFVPFSFEYLKKEFLAFKDNIIVFLGKYKNDYVAGAMIIFYQDRAYYHQGASLRKYSKVPVSHFLQWQAIKQAKQRNCSYYSFWGIAPPDKKNHPWKGITLFKKGFGGELEEYIPTQDYVISFRYWFDYLIEKLRSRRRGF